MSESLQVSDEEKTRMYSLFHSNLPKQSGPTKPAVICTAIEQLLNYSQRFYSRQFITRQKQHLDLVAHFEQMVKDYLDSNALAENGLPQVEYFAGQLNLSSGYLSDLLKKETGKTIKEYINLQIIDKAQKKLLINKDTVVERAWNLGFAYSQNFNGISNPG